MPRIITYSLRLDDSNSDDYYRTVKSLKDRWLAQTLPIVRDLLADFRAFQQHTDRAAVVQLHRSDAEYAFELLVLGVLLHEHADEAARLPGWVARILNTFESAQARWSSLELFLKSCRGVIAGFIRGGGKTKVKEIDLPGLLVWLRANGESGCTKRLAQWQVYIKQVSPAFAKQILERCLELASEFKKLADPVLGKYTQGVLRFLTEEAPAYRWRYDHNFVSRSRLEYHLGMLGSEVLNCAYRQRFLAAHNRVVIVPPCMRARSESECKAITTSFGMQCQGCTPTCRVHQITQMGNKFACKVFIIPDELRVFSSRTGDGNLGLVGVSCALTNWSGGWDTDELGIPAQGVLLDYVGCKYHWDKDGIPTDTNLRKLQEVLEIDDWKNKGE